MNYYSLSLIFKAQVVSSHFYEHWKHRLVDSKKKKKKIRIGRWMLIIWFRFSGKMRTSSSIVIVLTVAIAIYFTHVLRIVVAICFRQMPQTGNEGVWMATKFIVYLITTSYLNLCPCVDVSPWLRYNYTLRCNLIRVSHAWKQVYKIVRASSLIKYHKTEFGVVYTAPIWGRHDT